MIGRDRHTKVVFESILLGAYVGFQQLYSHLGRAVGLWVACGRFFRDYLPLPVIPQLAEEGNDRDFGVTAEGDALIAKAI